MTIGCDDGIERLQTDVGTQLHETVIDILHVSIVRNGERLLQDDASCVDVVVEEERRDTRQTLTIDNGPVDGSSTTCRFAW